MVVLRLKNKSLNLTLNIIICKMYTLVFYYQVDYIIDFFSVFVNPLCFFISARTYQRYVKAKDRLNNRHDASMLEFGRWVMAGGRFYDRPPTANRRDSKRKRNGR